MRKAFLIFSAFVLSAASFGQKGTLQVGIVGGPQSAWLINQNDSDDPAVKYGTGVTGFFGATVDYHFIDKLGVGIELVYNLKGQNYNPGYGNLFTNVTFTNFQLPILLNFNSNPDKLAMCIGKFGPRFDFVTGTSGTAASFQTVNIGLLLGVGVGFNIAKKVVISLSLRLDGGLTDPLGTNTAALHQALLTNYDKSALGTSGTRGKTWNEAGGIEIGVKYLIHVGKDKHGPTHSPHRR